MKNLLTSIVLLLFLTSPLFGQSSEDKKVFVRTSIFAHALTYNLDKQNGVGFHFGQIPPTEINKDNVETLEKSFFDCINIILVYSCRKMSKMESNTILLV